MRLAPEKGYEALSVEDLARGAAIGRSTFYGHYAGKDDFLDRSYADMLRSFNRRAWEAGERPVLPVRGVFAHVASARDFALSLARSGAFEDILLRRENVLRELAEQNLTRLKPDASAARRKETAIMLAGAYTALVRWWLERDLERSPEEMASWFERFAEGAISGL